LVPHLRPAQDRVFAEFDVVEDRVVRFDAADAEVIERADRDALRLSAARGRS